MPRRGEGIYKRKDGRWEARYIHHYEEGKAKYRCLYGSSYSEVKDRRSAELASKAAKLSAVLRRKAYFKELGEAWLDDRRSYVKESTYTRYHRTLHVYLLPELGNKQLAKLDIDFLKAFTTKLLSSAERKPLSPKTVSDIICILKAILRYGRENAFPCPNAQELSYPKKAKNKAEILSEEHRAKIENYLWDSGDTVALGILFTMYTGIRIGELCGLRWEDIDFARGTVSICRTVERIADLDPAAKAKTKLIITQPKTGSSLRTIPLPAFLLEHLGKYEESGNCYVTTGTQKHTEPHQIYMRYKTILRRSGVPEYTFHALRHSFATRCVESGFDTKSLSEILGHSGISTTLSLYVHPTLEYKRRQMELLAPGV